MDPYEERRRWAASGALALTGWPGGPPVGPPAGFVTRAYDLADSIAARSGRLGFAVRLDPLGVLTERAALRGWTRCGRTSCGGSSHLLAAADGWIAVSLARPEDVELVPAWLGVDPSDDVVAAVAAAVAERGAEEVVERAVMLGMPVGRVPALDEQRPATGIGIVRLGDGDPRTSLDGVVVADLSSLWAGPLCGAVLADAGATVIKVESTTRPDGTRRGPAAIFDLFNAGKRSVALDFTDGDDHKRLHRLLERVDVVIESSRPRALRQLGIHAEEMLGRARPSVWVSITGHGRGAGAEDRVAFGDDAAAAAGLVGWSNDEPCFCLDAVADPLTGLAAGDAVLDLLGRGGSWLVDASLAGVASSFAGPTLDAGAFESVPPVVRRRRGTGPVLGADTAAVLAEFGVDP